MTNRGARSGAASSARERVRRRRLVLGLAGGVLLLAIAFVASLALGAHPLSVSQSLGALVHYNPHDTNDLIVVDKRLPRTLIGVGAGLALGLAGAIMQGLTRNPLGDPGILGVNMGASLAVVVGITVFGVGGVAGSLWFAFAGAAAASVLVYSVASLGREGATPVKLALAGAAITAALSSIVTALLLADTQVFDQLRFWQVGALAGRGWDVLWQVLPTLVLGAVIALALGRALNGFALGDDVARALGQRVGASRLVCAVAVVLLCGSATAAAGPIAFVGLAVPHIARRVVGGDYRWVLAYSALIAPVLLLACDIIGRLIAFPGEVQVGVVTAFVGAPIFIGLVRRRKAVSL
ncbi:iron chelate uptake ABC transporter family permease subunit [Microbacterium sp. STN6]|nr:iron chelate uptake ABC transporter family permease subunit [Microbacterium sp. STN6]MCX7521836.1 iron chelate uptake ABC transporter family permease subunit [Microbacterium sp. STN6]